MNLSCELSMLFNYKIDCQIYHAWVTLCEFYFWVLLVFMKADMFIVEHMITTRFFRESWTQWTHVQPWSSPPSFLSLHCNAGPSSSLPQQIQAFLQKCAGCQIWPLLARHELCSWWLGPPRSPPLALIPRHTQRRYGQCLPPSHKYNIFKGSWCRKEGGIFTQMQ